MSSITTMPENPAKPAASVGVIGSGLATRRSPTNGKPAKLTSSLESGNSSRSSTSGEEGFVSGSSSAEEISYIDQLTMQMESAPFELGHPAYQLNVQVNGLRSAMNTSKSEVK